ncbi:MAG TPA: zinc-ribbon domain-containing protein [Pyrinomonadaceae bacterium]|nr:zinc-ribbon domain-containing protein [Pyrinomonadaceae bacterium]
MSDINCQNCGQPNADIARICRYCGTPLQFSNNQSSQQRPPDYAPPPQADFGGIPSWATPPPQSAPMQPLNQQPTPLATYTCPHCGSTLAPIFDRRISAAGWIVFFSLLIFCFPLCFIGLFIKEDYRKCSWCLSAMA